MKKLFLALSFTSLFTCFIAFDEISIAYSQYILTFFNITISFGCFLVFYELLKKGSFKGKKESFRFFKNDILILFSYYPFWVFVISLSISSILLMANINKHYLFLNILSLLISFSVILLVYFISLYSNLLNKKVLVLNNIPAFLNILLLIPPIFKDKFTIAKIIFDNSIFNTTLDNVNYPIIIIQSILLISAQIYYLNLKKK
jgi:hypothetical protein